MDDVPSVADWPSMASSILCGPGPLFFASAVNVAFNDTPESGWPRWCLPTECDHNQDVCDFAALEFFGNPRSANSFF